MTEYLINKLDLDLNSLKWKFDDAGFVILRNFFCTEELYRLEHLIEEVSSDWCIKLGADVSGLNIKSRLSLLESKYPQSFQQLATHIGTSGAGFNLASSAKLLGILGQLLGVNPYRLFCNNPAMFFNKRGVTRLQYQWHQEATYIRDYETAIHIWFPIFSDVTENDGPMLVKKGSHKQSYPFKTKQIDNGLTQLYISDETLSELETVPCTVNLGDIVIFQHNLVHCTGENKTDEPRLNIIVRYFDALAEDNFEPVLVYSPRVKP